MIMMFKCILGQLWPKFPEIRLTVEGKFRKNPALNILIFVIFDPEGWVIKFNEDVPDAQLTRALACHDRRRRWQCVVVGNGILRPEFYSTNILHISPLRFTVSFHSFSFLYHFIHHPPLPFES